MNPVAARQLVVTGIATTTILVTARAAVETKGLPPARAMAGLGLAFLFLSIGADIAPEVAGPLAALMAVSALVVPYKGKSSGQVLLGAVGAVG